MAGKCPAGTCERSTYGIELQPSAVTVVSPLLSDKLFWDGAVTLGVVRDFPTLCDTWLFVRMLEDALRGELDDVAEGWAVVLDVGETAAAVDPIAWFCATCML
jgi:hypothetical protein